MKTSKFSMASKFGHLKDEKKKNIRVASHFHQFLKFKKNYKPIYLNILVGKIRVIYQDSQNVESNSNGSFWFQLNIEVEIQTCLNIPNHWIFEYSKKYTKTGKKILALSKTFQISMKIYLHNFTK